MNKNVGRDIMCKNAHGLPEFQKITKEIAQIEKSIRNASPEPVKSRLRALYSDLLTKWPCLEGFWIRWAHTEFRIQNSVAALNIFRQAQKHEILLHSVVLWTEYFKFQLRVCQANLNVLKEELKVAASYLGEHFLSHEFWKLYVEVSDCPTIVLEAILNTHTLHQFSYFYSQLLNICTQTQNEPGETCSSISPEKLRIAYNLHSRRVKQVLYFEQRIKRPFFYPVPQVDTDVWLEYAKAVEDPPIIYYRALIPGYLNPRIWLSFIRYYIRTGAGHSKINALYELALCTNIIPVILHYALWLEYIGEVEKASDIYNRVIASGDKAALRQHAQFCSRHGESLPNNTESRSMETQENNKEYEKVNSDEDNDEDEELYYDEDL